MLGTDGGEICLLGDHLDTAGLVAGCRGFSGGSLSVTQRTVAWIELGSINAKGLC